MSVLQDAAAFGVDPVDRLEVSHDVALVIEVEVSRQSRGIDVGPVEVIGHLFRRGPSPVFSTAATRARKASARKEGMDGRKVLPVGLPVAGRGTISPWST